MIEVTFGDIGKEHIEALVANQVQEGKTIEYKRELPGRGSEECKEFLADVSSFANASGGDIVFGMDEERDKEGRKTGRRAAAIGLAGVTGDEAVLRLENMIRDGIDPRLTTQAKSIPGFQKGPVIVLGTPQSFTAPHMLAMRSSRFYSRNSAGKHSLEVQEIRAAFAASEAVPERIRQFREERLARIVAGETPVPLRPGPLVVVHLVPQAAFLPGRQRSCLALDSAAAFEMRKALSIPHSRYNIDGYLGYWLDRNDVCEHYVQLFGTGCLESADCGQFVVEDGAVLLPSIAYEQRMMSDLTKYLRTLSALGIGLPLVLMVALLGVRGCRMVVGGDETTSIDRDAVLIPDVAVEESTTEPGAALRPVFDAIWQACGFERSWSYDKEGNWVRHNR